MNQCILTKAPPYYCTVCDFGKGLNITETFSKNCLATPAAIAARKEQNAQLTEAAEKLGVAFTHVWRYKDALLRWRAADYPTRTTEDVAAIHATHCKPCDERVGDRCRKCGCRVAAGGAVLLNKLKMATEHCLEEKW